MGIHIKPCYFNNSNRISKNLINDCKIIYRCNILNNLNTAETGCLTRIFLNRPNLFSTD